MTNNLLAAINIPNRFFLNSPAAQGVFESPGKLISLFVVNATILAGVFTIVLILYGGFGIISSAGSGDAKSTAKFKAAITYGLVGFLIVITAFLVVQLIGTLIGVNFLNPTL